MRNGNAPARTHGHENPWHPRFSNANFFECDRESARIDSFDIEPAGIFEIVSVEGSTARVRAMSPGRATARISASLDGSTLTGEVSMDARVATEIRPVAYGGFPLSALVMDRDRR